MFPIRSFSGKNVAVFGLGISGMAAAFSLSAGGADVICWDDCPERVEKAFAAGLCVRDLRKEDWHKIEALVLAPGVPLTHPLPHWVVDIAHNAGVEIIGDIELFVRERRFVAPQSTFVAITGTNGKSTTTALIAHILKENGMCVEEGGNIGRAVTDFAPLSSCAYYVIECSSFQIELSPSIDPSFAVLLNLSPDHLDRHGTMERYVSMKERLLHNATHSIIGVDDAYCSSIARGFEEREDVSAISASTVLENGYYAEQHFLLSQQKGKGPLRLVSLEGLHSLRGKHNAQNALAALVVCSRIGLSLEKIQRALSSFQGLAHRMEILGRRGRVLFYNDSKATNAEATASALSSFSRFYWILGGQPKENGIESLRSFFPRVVRAYIIGEAAPLFAETFGDSVSFNISGTLLAALEEALEDAEKDTAQEVVILFSPACASFDQFKNFEVRGDAFSSAVKALEGFVPIHGAKR